MFLRFSLIIVAGVAVLTAATTAPSNKIAFLDVGQGDAILLQQGTTQFLIDGGAGNAVLTRLSEELPYFDRTIEVVIATHPDRDHLEGLLHVLEKYQVKLVVLPRVAHTSQLQAEWLTRLQAAASAHQIEYRFTTRGQQMSAGQLTVTVLHPAATTGVRTSKTNNASVTTRINFADMSAMLSGDAEAAVEREIVAGTPPTLLDVAILKAGHHGSKTSTDATWLAATSPRVAIISAGKNNSYGHPHPTVLARLAAARIPVMRTDASGTIRFERTARGWVLGCGTKPLFAATQKSCMKES